MTLEEFLRILIKAGLLTPEEAQFCLMTPLHFLPDEMPERLAAYLTEHYE